MPRFFLIAAGLILVITVVLQLMPESPLVVTADSMPVQTTTVTLTAESKPMESGSPLAAPLKPVLRQVAQQYQRQNQWPSYSLPLSDHQLELIYPNQGAEISQSLQPLGLNGELRIDLDHFRYRVGETLSAQVSLIADDALLSQISELKITVIDRQKKTLQQLSSRLSEQSQGNQWQAQIIVPDSWPQEASVNAQMVFVDGQQLNYSAPFQVFDPVAEVAGVKTSHVDDNELIIPVDIKKAKSGYYKLAAALFTEQNQPIAYLQGKAKIASSTGMIELKVHGSLLAGLGPRQDLVIKSFQLRRIPARPGDGVIGWGISREPSYVIKQVNPALFDDRPFQNAQVIARAEFLKNLAQ
ncbi:MAG: hypothetical protein MK185_03490 [Saccharospirillaceae bacterium]|nr:hypothetical protein [Saccharospirillaceae bacterium]